MKGDECPYDHELSKYPCNNVVENGFCSRGEICLFSHKVSAEDLKAKASVSKNETCSPDQLVKSKKSALQPSVDNVQSSGITTPKNLKENLAVQNNNKPTKTPNGLSFLSFGKPQPNVDFAVTNNGQSNLGNTSMTVPASPTPQGAGVVDNPASQYLPHFSFTLAISGSKVKPLNHSHGLPPPGKKGRPYICSSMIFLRPTVGAKLVMKKWIQELEEQPWTRTQKSNDQPTFNWALMKTESQVDMYLVPQYAFPTGGLYFKNKTWVRETKGSHVIIHNNYILGFEKKIKRFRDYGLWLVDDYASESPLGKL